MIACVRCGGTLERTSDQYGGYIHCLMCGHLVDDEPKCLPTLGPAHVDKLRAEQIEAERKWQREATLVKKRDYFREYYRRPEVHMRRMEYDRKRRR